MIKNLKDKNTDIHKDTFIAETADIIGDVRIGQGSSVWYSAVLRGDINYVKVGEYSNIQDNATLHVETNLPCEIGDYTTVGHNAVVHGCKVGNNCLIGMGAIILNGAEIGDNSIIGAGSVVTENSKIPANSLVVGIPGKVKREISDEDEKAIRDNAKRYEKLWRSEYK